MTDDITPFDRPLRLLNGRLAIAGAPNYYLVICGGTALIAANLVQRATRDVDIVAMADSSGRLIDPAPLPDPLANAAREVAEDMGLPHDWLNNGPSSGDGGLFRLGLPQGLADRLRWRRIGEKLAVAFIGRFDQIHFKLYAAVDQYGGYHATDLQALKPKDEELLAAVAWARSHDPSAEFKAGLKSFLREFGYEHLCERI